MKPKLLLHSCCAPCSIYVVKQLLKNYQVTIFFYDPNIHPRKEYNKRLKEIKDYATKSNVEFIEGEYDSKNWFDKVKGFELEPEKGKRCTICFDIRLGRTAMKAKEDGYDAWTTVLTLSPHKDEEQISQVGNKLARKVDVPFLDIDWKQNEGFKKACQLSKEWDFYRQNYCGCIYSKK